MTADVLRLQLLLMREKWRQRVLNLSENAKSCFAAVFYGVCSISLNFLNKAVVSSFDFNFPYFIMTCQMAATVLALDAARIVGLLPSLAAYSWRDAGRSFAPASLCFALHATLSLSALHGMNIPMYGAIKRCTPLVNLILSVLVLKKAFPSRSILLSIGVITIGCLLASAGDLEFDGHAYVLGGLSVFAQAGYLTLVQKCSSDSSRSTLSMIHVNGYNTLPVFIVASVVMGEPSRIAEAEYTTDWRFLLTLASLVCSGCVLTYSQFLCASVCSALTASLVGVAKSVLQTAIGFFTFGGVRFHPLNVLGLFLNTFGAALYSYVKYEEGKKAHQGDVDDDVESAKESAGNVNGYVLVPNASTMTLKDMHNRDAVIHKL